MKVSLQNIGNCRCDFTLIRAIFSLFPGRNNQPIVFHEPADYFFRQTLALFCKKSVDSSVFVSTMVILKYFFYVFADKPVFVLSTQDFPLIIVAAAGQLSAPNSFGNEYLLSKASIITAFSRFLRAA